MYGPIDIKGLFGLFGRTAIVGRVSPRDVAEVL